MTHTMIVKRSTLANALRTAADQYAADANAMIRLPHDPLDKRSRIIAQFEHQAHEARDLADVVPSADLIKLED